MSTDDFELVLRTTMRSRAAELDRVLPPAPGLRVVLASGGVAGRKFGRISLGLALSFAAALVVAIALLSGSGPLRVLENQPLATVSPSAPASASPTPIISSHPSRASPTATPSVAIVLEPLAN